jgi:hypothetical protein
MTGSRSRRVAHADWRRLASEEDLREYDAFGPWIYEINSESDTPKAFRAACVRHRDARFLLKAPRNVERRDVRPGMDLYVAVLAVHDDGLSLMRLIDERVVSQDIVWSEAAALESHKDLLYSRWTLMLRDGGAFILEYNTVSAGLIGKVTDFVRSRWTRHSEAPSAGAASSAVTVVDRYFRNALIDQRRHGPQPVEPIHFEPAGRYCRDAANRFAISTGVMFLDAPDELIIVNRDKPTRRFFEAVDAVSCIFIPYASLTSFALAPPPAGRAARFHQLRLNLDKQVIEQSCLVEPTGVLARLAAYGAPRTA